MSHHKSFEQQIPHSKTVYIFQDIHLNPEAQINIANAIKFIAPQVLGLEGLHLDQVDMEAYFNYPDKNNLKNTALALVNVGLLTGGEFAAITHTGNVPIQIFGVENANEYNSNVSALRESMALRKQARNYLLQIKTTLNKMKSQSSSVPLNQYLDDHIKYHLEDKEISTYIKELDQFIPVQGHHIQKLFHVLHLEEEIDMNQLESERIQKLLKILSLQYEINIENLLLEIKQWEKSIETQFALTGPQQHLVSLTQDYILLHKLLHLQMTPSEWIEYQNIKVKLDSQLKNMKLSFNFSPFEDFYTWASQRNATISEKMIRQMNQPDVKKGVLVVGGFHANAIYKNLKDEEFSVHILTPKITKLNSNKFSSLQIMNSRQHPLDRLFSGEKLFLSTPASALGGAGNRIQKIYTHLLKVVSDVQHRGVKEAKRGTIKAKRWPIGKMIPHGFWSLPLPQKNYSVIIRKNQFFGKLLGFRKSFSRLIFGMVMGASVMLPGYVTFPQKATAQENFNTPDSTQTQDPYINYTQLHREAIHNESAKFKAKRIPFFVSFKLVQHALNNETKEAAEFLDAYKNSPARSPSLPPKVDFYSNPYEILYLNFSEREDIEQATQDLKNREPHSQKMLEEFENMIELGLPFLLQTMDLSEDDWELGESAGESMKRWLIHPDAIINLLTEIVEITQDSDNSNPLRTSAAKVLYLVFRYEDAIGPLKDMIPNFPSQEEIMKLLPAENPPNEISRGKPVLFFTSIIITFLYSLRLYIKYKPIRKRQEIARRWNKPIKAFSLTAFTFTVRDYFNQEIKILRKSKESESMKPMLDNILTMSQEAQSGADFIPIIHLILENMNKFKALMSSRTGDYYVLNTILEVGNANTVPAPQFLSQKQVWRQLLPILLLSAGLGLFIQNKAIGSTGNHFDLQPQVASYSSSDMEKFLPLQNRNEKLWMKNKLIDMKYHSIRPVLSSP